MKPITSGEPGRPASRTPPATAAVLLHPQAGGTRQARCGFLAAGSGPFVADFQRRHRKGSLLERLFLSWLEQQQIPYELCAVSDLDRHPDLIANYRLFVSIGHDEYWSRQMRTSVENFIGSGGNVAFLSGNTCYWQIRFENGGDTIVCYKDKQLDPLATSHPALTTVLWSDPPASETGAQAHRSQRRALLRPQKGRRTGAPISSPKRPIGCSRTPAYATATWCSGRNTRADGTDPHSPRARDRHTRSRNARVVQCASPDE